LLENSCAPRTDASASRRFCRASRCGLARARSRSGITGGVSPVALIRFDVNHRLLAARQLTPFSVHQPQVSIPTFGPGYLPRFVTLSNTSVTRLPSPSCHRTFTTNVILSEAPPPVFPRCARPIGAQSSGPPKPGPAFPASDAKREGNRSFAAANGRPELQR
jgi:hypothetical protein